MFSNPMEKGAFIFLLFLTSFFNVKAQTPYRTFQTSFETVADFQGFYIVPQNQLNTASHDTSSEEVHSGNLAHKGWVYGANPPSTDSVNNNHRGYPTVQLFNTPGGAFITPALIELWVWLDMEIAPGEWFSFATLDHTTSTTWDAVLVNLSDAGFVHLMHVPYNGQGIRTFQTTSITFPMRQWVKLSMAIHFDSINGYAKVWQDDQLVSEANVLRGNGYLTQAHFGLYAPPSISQGVIYNDDLKIMENQLPSGIEEPRHSVNQLFPNPNDGRFTLKTDAKNGELFVYNAIGELKFQSVIDRPETRFEIDLPAGIYFYSIKDKNAQAISHNRLVVH